MAQKVKQEIGIEISLESDEKIETELKNNSRINKETGFPMSIYGMKYELPQGTPEEKAMYYLQKESKGLGISTDEIVNLRHRLTRTTGAGTVVRYNQYFGDYPVNNYEVTISISPQNKVVFVMNEYQKVKMDVNVQPTVSKERAYDLAFNYLNIQSDVTFKENRLMIYKNTKTERLAHEITILTSIPLGEWHVFVDAKTEEIFKVEDKNFYYKEHINNDSNKSKKNIEKQEDNVQESQISAFAVVDGTGMVFNPDPLSSNAVAYGGNYSDNNDATNTDLDNARFSVVLRDIEEIGGVYKLKGPRAEIVDFDAPNDGLFTQNTSVFNFTREEQGFEPVNCYYHIDFMMGYVNTTLGISALPQAYVGGVRYDPHGANGADNSYFSPASDQLSFGEGCVDDGEDSDVIHHELGHGLHDFVTGGSASSAEGLGEGSGDYVAQSYNRSLGNWAPTDAAYNFMFNWDVHNQCWNGRITNYGAIYPGGLVGSIHTDGQIWASCLMGIWDQIGKEPMDRIFYEGLGMTNGSSNQNDAANAVYQAAINLSYTNAQLTIIYSALTTCGYTLPAMPGPPVAAFSADNEIICLDDNNTVNFTDDSVSSPAATSWSWIFEGGTPATSTDQNPTVTYAAEGIYDVTLLITNVNGNDTLAETDFITVQAGANCPACVTPTNTTVVPISDGAGDTYTSIINVSSAGLITDVNVIIDITHTWDADLVISLTSPIGVIVVLTDENGSLNDNYTDTVFDQQATTPITSGSAPFTGLFIPEGDLDTLNGLDAVGDWTLTVVDGASGDGGQLNFWSIEVCVDSTVSISEHSFDNFSIYPNPNDGSFSIKLNSTSNSKIKVEVYDISGRIILNNSYENTFVFEKNIKLNSIQSGVYLIKVSDGERESIDKIIVR